MDGGFINNLIRFVTTPVNPDDMPVAAPHDEPMETDHVHDDNEHDDADDMPELQSVSDSDYDIDSDEDGEGDGEEDDDEETEVMMQTVDGNDNDDEGIPPLEPIPRTNRRPRVADDEDGERDRRHPSQRVNQPLDVTNPPQDPPASWNGPVNTGIAVPFRPSADWINAVQAQVQARARARGQAQAQPQAQQAHDNQQPNQNQQQQPQQQQQQQQPGQQGRQPMINGFAITIDINGQRVVRPLQTGVPFDGPGPGPGAGAGAGGFADFLGLLNALSERETDDPERAKRLVDALEEVPVGLVRRLEALSGKTADTDGEAGTGGMGAGDCACAICWDTLLDGEGGFAVNGDDSIQEGQAQAPEDQDTSTSTSTPPPPSTSNDQQTPPNPTPTKMVSSSDPTQPKIVSLPCAHVFHAACLIPWFSRPRQTTCPTCRFNIDPERLTARRMRGIYRPRTQAQGQAPGPGQQQQANVAPDGQGTPATNTNSDVPPNPNADPAEAQQPQVQPQPQPQPANPNAPGQRNPALMPGAVLTIGFDIVIGPHPNMGPNPNANANANAAQNANATNPAPNTNTNAGGDAGANEGVNQNPDQNQNQNPNVNANANPAFTMGPMNMDMENIMAGMGMGDMTMGMGMVDIGGMDEDVIEEVAMMDMNDAQAAQEFGEFLRNVLPIPPPGLHPHHHHHHHPHPHPDPHPPAGDAAPPPPAPPAPAQNPAPQQQQQQQQQHQQPGQQPGQAQGQGQAPMMGVFSGTATGRTLGEALAALFTQPLQPVNMQAGTQNAGAGVRTHPGAQQPQPQGQQQQHGEEEHEHERREEEEHEEGREEEGHGQDGQGQPGMPGMPDPAAFQNFLSALFTSVAQQQAQQMQARGTGQGQGQGQGAAHNNDSDAQAEDQQEAPAQGAENQPQPQPQPQNANPPPPGFVMGAMPLPPTFVGPPVFSRAPPLNLGNLFAGLGDVFGVIGGNVLNGQPQPNAEAGNGANDVNAGNGGNNNAGQPNANANAPGPAMNIPFIPFASLFPGATLTPPPAPAPAPAPAPGSAVGNAVDEGQAQGQAQQGEQREHGGQQQPVDQQLAQAEADDGSFLGEFTRLLAGADVAVVSQPLNAPNGLNAANATNDPQPQPQQAQAGGLPTPAWAQDLPPLPFPVQPQQPQQQGQAPGQGQGQQPRQGDAPLPPPGFMRFQPPRAPREKKPWTLPPAPGPTLRQRIEKREREAGLRCYDVSCGVGPSDEDPFVGLTEKTMRQLSIRACGKGEGEAVCPHTFHPACLVSAARVANALMGADGADEDGDGDRESEGVSVGNGDLVDVSCSVCRSTGRVRTEEWYEGVRALA